MSRASSTTKETPVAEMTFWVLWNCLHEMDHLVERFPYGKTLMQKVIKKFGIFRSNPQDRRSDKVSHYGDRMIRKAEKCMDTYIYFKKWRRFSRIEWIQNHDQILNYIIRTLGTYNPNSRKFESYSMSDPEYEEWRIEIFKYIKKYTYTVKQKDHIVKKQHEQICIDAMVDLIRLSEDYTEEGVYQKHCQFLRTLCGRAKLIPTSFVLTGVEFDKADLGIQTGASAVVYRGTLDGQPVAIKSFRMYKDTIDTVTKKFCQEAFIVKQLSHPNVLPFIGVIYEQDKLCIVSPWLANGDILVYLRSHPEASKKELLEQIADGMDFISQKGIVHGDLKGNNILVTDEGKACISDFGSSKFIETVSIDQPHGLAPQLSQTQIKKVERRAMKSIKSRGFTSSNDNELEFRSLVSTLTSMVSTRSNCSKCYGTDRWMAPEMLFPTCYKLEISKATFASDVYSYSMITIEVYSGCIPFPESTPAQVVCKIFENKRPGRPRGVPDTIWSIIQACWNPDPGARPLIRDVYNQLACMGYVA